MNIPFIHKYKPLNLLDLNMRDEVNQLINTFIEMNDINIILIGDSGTCKTSIINCIIEKYYDNKMINIYEDEENILYINSLKEQGISYYRNEVKTFCQTTCSIKGKKKILVLDDMDKINEQSQQVFRNYIDKYRHNVNFLCSCNNLQKIIDTIQSRTTLIKLDNVSYDFLHRILMNICDKENIQMDEESIKYIIHISNYSIRVIINYLEKFKLLNKKITLDICKQLTTDINYNLYENFTNLCKKKDINNAIEILYNIYYTGFSVLDILDNYYDFLKETNMLTEECKYKLIPLICKYITAFHYIHEDKLELVFFTNNIIKNIL